MNRLNHWIDGQRTDGVGTRTAPVTDPATGTLTGEVVLATTSDVDTVVASSVAAFNEWRNASLSKRTDIFFAYRALLDDNRAELARAIASEHGKVFADALGEVQRGLEVVEFACGIPNLLKGEMTPDVSSSVDAYSMRQPVGVVAGITPFNFPVMVPMWMFPMAIACGNTFILKPSEKDPSGSLLMAELFTEAGLPPGVLNVLQGDAEAVNGLLDHPDVSGVSFVGSTPIARQIHQRASANGKRVQALGGAKNHMIVLPDADIDQAADAAVSAGYGSAGERCMAISVVVAVGDVADALVPAIVERTEALKIGPGLSADPMDMGALVTEAHRDRVSSYIDLGLGEGAELVLDGRGLTVDDHPDGFWLGPCLFDRVTTEMKIYEDEIFGPVLCVMRAGSYDEALTIVNDNPYGNGAAIFTNDGGAARAFQREVKAGMVGVNVPIPVPMAYHSFGGWKDSLFGDTHVYGPEGVKFYTQYKAVTVRWPDPSERGVDLGFPQAT
ncbi:MAG: malonate-semialdehyde dehydrogenase (acetylating)/methylmalonate-semialdehyde dehydrogenase [Acidimicrobiales bacterium]|jgi:malonate-semialdehyde dehydrogenase (acetylating)/methylmalonate-semialdehyde dehydrogenase